MKARYVDPFSDFGFKKLFGEEASKPALIDFLNALLQLSSPIEDLTFKNTEQLGDIFGDRKAVYDIYCESANGEKFIVELQKAKQNYFRERTIFYSTFPIREQAEKGGWDFNLKAVYCIGILDFTFDDDETEKDINEFVQNIQLRDKKGRTFYEKLTYLYIEMPRFNKTLDQLETRLDKWLYFVKHLEDFDAIPQIFRNEVVFTEVLHKAELARFTQAEMDRYEYSLKAYRDVINTHIAIRDSARKEGLEEGLKEGLKEGLEKGLAKGLEEGIEKGIEKARKESMQAVARNLKSLGISIEIIQQTTGLTTGEIDAI